MPTQLGIFVLRIGQQDDQITNLAQVRNRTVQANLSRLTFDRVGDGPFPIGQIEHMDLFTGKDVGEAHQAGVDAA
jgi:hypothetical protein